MKNEKWMTVNEAVQLFREKKSDFTEQHFAHLAIKYNFPKKHPRVGWGKSDAIFQAYSADAVLECFKKYKPKNRFTYTVNTPPPSGWLTLRNIADYLGANFARVQKMCSKLTVPARFYKGKRYAPLALFEELLPWRPSFFVRKHRSDEWIQKRIAWQKEKKLEKPFNAKYSWNALIFAPELIHL